MFLCFEIYHFFLSQKYDPKNIVFIHLNHQVREESYNEAKLVAKWFEGVHLELITRPKTPHYTENDLRKRRYQTFLEIMNREDVDKIFLGHHFDDRVETSFLNLLRWCGIDGFMGIKHQESHHLLQGKMVIRPLLNISKSTIMDRCAQENIPYVLDKSNQDPWVSQRNYIRQTLIPQLFSEQEVRELFEHWYQKYDTQTKENKLIPITISPYRNAKSAYRLSSEKKDIDQQDLLRIFKQLHASAGITRDMVQDFFLFIKTANSWRKYFQGITVMLSHGKVYFFSAPLRFREKTLDKQEEMDTLHQVQRFPQKNDSFKGKTRNKYCISQKIPLFRRNFIPIIAKGNKIVSRDKKWRKETIIL
jgi:tRNA(Ile)-lysidine synthetase-like protein